MKSAPRAAAGFVMGLLAMMLVSLLETQAIAQSSSTSSMLLSAANATAKAKLRGSMDDGLPFITGAIPDLVSLEALRCEKTLNPAVDECGYDIYGRYRMNHDEEKEPGPRTRRWLVGPNPEETSVFWEGDIIPSFDQPDPEAHFRANGVRGAEDDPNLLWPDGVVHYEFGEGIDEEAENVIETAMYWFHVNTTCVRFEMWSGEPDYIEFVSSSGTELPVPEGGCGSHVGRIGGRQLIIVSPDCLNVDTILHLLGHTIGFVHEDNRFDRDTYVDIVWENLQKTHDQYFTKRRSPPSFAKRYPYDYSSFMHRSKFAHGAHHGSGITIVPKHGGKRVEIGQRAHLSPTDRRRINDLYRCDELAPLTTTTARPTDPTTSTTELTTVPTTTQDIPTTTLSDWQDFIFRDCANFQGNTGEGTCWQTNDPDNCTRFIKCANNIASFFDCPAYEDVSLHYDIYTCKCEWPQGACCRLGGTLPWCNGCNTDNESVSCNFN